MGKAWYQVLGVQYSVSGGEPPPPLPPPLLLLNPTLTPLHLYTLHRGPLQYILSTSTPAHPPPSTLLPCPPSPSPSAPLCQPVLALHPLSFTAAFQALGGQTYSARCEGRKVRGLQGARVARCEGCKVRGLQGAGSQGAGWRRLSLPKLRFLRPPLIRLNLAECERPGPWNLWQWQVVDHQLHAHCRLSSGLILASPMCTPAYLPACVRACVRMRGFVYSFVRACACALMLAVRQVAFCTRACGVHARMCACPCLWLRCPVAEDEILRPVGDCRPWHLHSTPPVPFLVAATFLFGLGCLFVP